MYPTTIFNWIDQSGLNIPAATPELDASACFFCVSSFDKGPEKLMEISGSDFDSLFGTVEFSKHGQAGIQAKRIIDAGGRVLIKRVVATDATLANLILCANVTNTATQKKNDQGQPLYYDDDGNETTEVTDNPVMLNDVKVKWTANRATNCKTFAEVETAAKAMLNEQTGVYPMYVITDNGRGVSGKAIRFTPDYNTSKSYGTTFYSLKVYEGTSISESQMVSFDPNVVLNDTAYGVDLGITRQVDCEGLTDVFDKYVEKIAGYIGITADLLKTYDLIFCYDNTGAPIPALALDPDSIDLNSLYGIALGNGSNGAFGDAPVDKPEWTEAIRAVFAGEVTDEVWDKDEHKIGAIFDANYPDIVKEAIAQFVTFREDCVFFRDLGTGNTTFSAIKDRFDAQSTKNKFIADYLTSGTVKDPITAKNIEVTMMYDFAPLVASKFAGAVYAPLAGTYNGCTLPSFIKGTINFTPVVTPSVNQRSALDDMGLNYAIFQGDTCVVQSCYSSQDKKTELSWINNVMAVQEVMRAIRTACPQNRYRFVTSTDFSVYKEAVDTVLSNYRDHFNVLNFVYTEDKLMSAQKIFYGSLEFAFGQWAQTEIFDMFILNSGNL